MQSRSDNKTREIIKDCFFSLLMSRADFEKLTAKLIIERAHVNKSTFYRYFDSKYALLEEITDDLLNGFGDLLSRPSEIGFQQDLMYECLYAYFEYIRKNYRLYNKLLAIPESRFIKKQQEFLKKFFTGSTHELYLDPVDGDYQKLRPYIISWLYSGMIIDWIDEKMITPPEKMADRLTMFWRHYYMLDS